jgi:CDP-diacylglycerol--serine O-phosphatidyltransferase
MYLWALQDARSAGWIMVMIYTICCVLRLARFNVGNKSHIDVMAGPMAEPLSDDKRFFIGVPSPAGAFLVMLPLFVGRLFPEMMQPHALLIGGYMVLIGLLMISRLPTFSFKATKIYAEYARFMVIALVAGVAALFTWPWATLVGLDLAYFGVLIWSWIAFRARVRATPPS